VKIAWHQVDYRQGVVVPPNAFPPVTVVMCRCVLLWRRLTLLADRAHHLEEKTDFTLSIRSFE